MSDTKSYDCTGSDVGTAVDQSEKCRVGDTDARTSNLPIDRGYAWLIVTVAFLSYCATGCLWTSFSVMYIHYVELWDSSVASVGLVISLYAAGLQFVGVFFGAAIEGNDVRLTGIVGGVVSSVATLCACFSPNVSMLAVLYGLTGAGHSVVYLSVSSTVQCYFQTKRPLASGITLTGYSLAGFLYPPLTRYLLDHYGWSGTLLIFSGVHLQNIWLCALLRPVESRKVVSTDTTSEKSGSVPRKCDCREVIRKKLQHLVLLRQPRLLLFLVVNLIFNIGYNGFFFHIVNRALFIGIGKSTAAFLATVSAIVNLVWRPLFGLIATLLTSYVNNIIVYGMAFIVISAAIFVFPLVYEVHWMVFILVIFGLAGASMATVQHPTLVDLVGINNITGGICLLMMFCGIGQIVASPFAGWLYEVTLDYDVAYFVSAALVLLAAILCFTIFAIGRCDRSEISNTGLVMDKIKS